MGNASAIRAFEGFFKPEQYFFCTDCTYGYSESVGVYSWTLLSAKGSIVLRSYYSKGTVEYGKDFKILSISGNVLNLRNKKDPYLLCTLTLSSDGSWILLNEHPTEKIYQTSRRMQFLQLRSKHGPGSLNNMCSLLKANETNRHAGLERKARQIEAIQEREEKEERARQAREAREAKEYEQNRQREQRAKAAKEEQEKRDRAKRLEEQRKQQAASSKTSSNGAVVGYGSGNQGGNASSGNKSDYHPQFGYPYRKLVSNTLGAGTLSRLVNKAKNMYIDVWAGVFIPVGASTEACYTNEGRLVGNILSGSVVPQVVIQSLYPFVKVTIEYQTIDFNFDMQTAGIRGYQSTSYSRSFDVTTDLTRLYNQCNVSEGWNPGTNKMKRDWKVGTPFKVVSVSLAHNTSAQLTDTAKYDTPLPEIPVQYENRVVLNLMDSYTVGNYGVDFLYGDR